MNKADCQLVAAADILTASGREGRRLGLSLPNRKRLGLAPAQTEQTDQSQTNETHCAGLRDDVHVVNVHIDCRANSSPDVR